MKRIGFLLAFFILSTTVFALNQSAELKGIKTVNVKVAVLPDGVEEETLRTTLELALTTAGLTVLPQDQYSDTVPTIILRVSSIKEPGGRFYATDIALACLDNVSNQRMLSVFSAVIWSNDVLQLLGVIDSSRIIEGERKLIDLFLNDYLQANPK
jgi:hypothetical protein